MTTQQSVRFRSKIDLWLVAILVIALLMPLYLTFTARGADKGTQLSPLEMVLMFGLPWVLIVWFYASTEYEVTATELLVRSGPVRKTIPLDTLSRIRPSNSIMSAPALSIDRLELQYNKFDEILISPADKRGFLAAIVARAPQVTLERLDEFR